MRLLAVLDRFLGYPQVNRVVARAMPAVARPKPGSEQMAELYRRLGEVYIISHAKTVVGIWQATETVFVRDAEDAEGIVAAVLDALAASVEGIPHPEKINTSPQVSAARAALFKAAQVRSYSAFATDAVGVVIERTAEHYSLVPMKNLGGRKGFAHLPDRKVELDAAENLWEAISLALSRAE